MASQNLGLQTQKLKELKPGSDTESFSVARKYPIITESTVQEVTEALRFCIMLVGIRAENMPSELEKQLLIFCLAKQFGNHTLAEVKLAFEMAIAGKLDCDPRPFENFSPLYLSTILVAYRKWASAINRQIEQTVPELPPAAVDVRNVMEELYELHQKDAVAGKLRMEFCQVILYDWMVGTGRINISEADKKNWFEKAVNHERWSIAENRLTNFWTADLKAFNQDIESKNKQSPGWVRAANTAKRFIIYQSIIETLQTND